MSDSTTKTMIAIYNEMAKQQPTLFLSSLFKSGGKNFYNSESIELDIVRSEEDVAIVIQDLTLGYRGNAKNLYTNKSFVAPIFKESITLNSFELLKRRAGDNPFQDINFRQTIIEEMFNNFVAIEAKIRRAIELQASQVLQTGVLTLKDANGTALYTLDFKPKATHFPVAVSPIWGATNATPLDDIDVLARVVRADGKFRPDQLIFGSKAWMAFIQDPTVKALMDNRRIDLGAINMGKTNSDSGTYHGTIEIGAYPFELWTYDGLYKDPQTGTITEFVSPGKVIIRASSGRLDATFGFVPHIASLIGIKNLIPEMPSRINSASRGMDLFPNIWLSEDGTCLFGGLSSRPLLIPTALDTFACLDTGL